MEHFLLIEDHQDIFENLERKILEYFPKCKLSIASNCDEGYDVLKKNMTEDKVSMLILDLNFNNNHSNTLYKSGRELMNELKIKGFEIPILIYSTFSSLEHIYPIINNYKPKGYVIKTHNSSEELLFAMSRVLDGEVYFSQKVNDMLFKRNSYKYQLDETDELIIKFLPKATRMEDWTNQIPYKSGFMSYKSIKLRIDNMCVKLEVENEKQLLLKLQRLGIL